MINEPTPETDAFNDQMLEEFIDPAWLVFSQQLERERDEAREELATVTAQRDRLAEALRVATAYPLTESWYKQAIEALATLKPCD